MKNNQQINEYVLPTNEILVICQDVTNDLKQMVLDIDKVQLELDAILLTHENK